MLRLALSSLWLTPILLGATTLAAVASAPQAIETVPVQKDGTFHGVDGPQAPLLVAEVPSKEAASVGMDRVPSIQDVASYQDDLTQVNGQVTSVSQLTDVKPTDWAFQALQSLVERYGCIVGYPDKTYRGNRALSRYEFAAGVNACLDRINELLAAATADLVRKEDLIALQKLQEEFAAELAALRGQVDALEARTATLEKQQFSTTTKLTGEVIFAISDTFGDAATRNGSNGFITAGTPARRINRDDNTNTIFSDRVRLAFDTSFNGKDRLRTRLQARNTTPFSGALTGTNQTRLSFDGSEGNAVGVDKLYYRFAVGDNLRIQIDAINDEVYDALISSLSPFESSGSGAVSRFGRFNPVLRINNPQSSLARGGSTFSGSAGITLAYKFNDVFRVEGGYLSDTASNDPGVKNGLFNGAYAAIAQVVFTPGNFTFGINYSHSYYPGNDVNLTGSTGSSFASSPFGAVATSADTVGGSVQYKFSPQFLLGGWAGASFAHRRSNSDEATVLNAAVYAAFPDFGKEGNLLGILAGLPPRVIDNDVANREDREAYSVHLEGFYRYRINDNIAITPGIFVIFNPENNARNDTEYVGVLRTTFTF